LKSNKALVVALYLPQFHPIPENDKWWGKGFTEWTNVTKAKPLFPGHHQPYLPSELGFYDLRVNETRIEQAKLASEYGVDAFCYYHYWFGNKKTLLQKPLQELIKAKEPDFPFMVCWANQSWSGVWHGLDKKVLIEQEYPGLEDEKDHFNYLLTAFKDERYLKVNKMPVFMVYQPNDIPNVKEFCDRWRTWAVESGLGGLYLIAENSDPFWNPNTFGFDAFVHIANIPKRRNFTASDSILLKLKNLICDKFKIPSIYDYRKFINHFVPDSASPLAIPCIIPNWDNTPRSGHNGVVFKNSTPDLFYSLIVKALNRRELQNKPDNMLFIKSWNEWAEGNVLEPSRKDGRSYLVALKKAINTYSNRFC
jgi:hypothetical protein